MKKFLTIAGNTILTILIFVGLIIGFSLLPIKNNYKIYFVTSGSMEPAISTGSVVVSKPKNEYRVGDIVTFKNIGSKKPQDTTTHRIVEIQQSQTGEIEYQTKGDANDTKDNEFLPNDRIVGRELFSVPLIGYLVGYIKTLPGLLIIIIIPAAIIIYEEIKKISAETKKIILKRKTKKTGGRSEKNN